MKESDKEGAKGLLIKEEERWQREKRKKRRMMIKRGFLHELFYSLFLNKK